MKCTFPLALTFLTILPWPGLPPAQDSELARSLFWFPWVGALLGLLYWGLMIGLARLFPPAIAAVFLLTLTVILTRGLHLDGLADTADGLAGGKTPEERRRIMKDSRLGAFGAMSLILVLLLKYALFLGLAQKGSTAGLLLSPIVSRWGLVFLAYLSPYARPEGGLGQAMTSGASLRLLLGGTAGATGLAVAAAGVKALAVMGAAAVITWLLSRFFLHKLEGITGDVLGATNELLEVLALTGMLL